MDRVLSNSWGGGDGGFWGDHLIPGITQGGDDHNYRALQRKGGVTGCHMSIIRNSAVSKHLE